MEPLSNKSTRKQDRQKKKDEKKAIRLAVNKYTEAERSEKATNMMLELSSMDIMKHFTYEQSNLVSKLFSIYSKTGLDIEKDIDIDQLQRTMIFRLYGSKGKKSYINLKLFENPVVDKNDEKKINAINELSDTLKDMKSTGIDLSKKPIQI